MKLRKYWMNILLQKTLKKKEKFFKNYFQRKIFGITIKKKLNIQIIKNLLFNFYHLINIFLILINLTILKAKDLLRGLTELSTTTKILISLQPLNTKQTKLLIFQIIGELIRPVFMVSKMSVKNFNFKNLKNIFFIYK